MIEMFFERDFSSFGPSKNHIAHLGKNKDINTNTCGDLMLFDQLMKSLATLLEIASEQQALSQDTFNNPFRSFLSQPTFENAEAIAKYYESTPLFNVHLGEDSLDSKVEENIGVCPIQISLAILGRNMLETIGPNQPHLSKGKHSLFTVNPKFIHGVSINSFANYKKALKDKFGCDIPPNFDLFYQFLNFKAVLDILNDESQKMEISSRLFKLVTNVFDSILNENFEETCAQEISSDFEVFFDALKEYMEYMAQQRPTLFWVVMKRILPLKFFSSFLFSCVDDTTVAMHPLIFPCSRLYIFNDTNFSYKGRENERSFSFKNEYLQEGYQSASVIVVSKPRGEEYSGFVPVIRLNNSEVYTICGVHVCSEGKIDSFYPLSKHFPFEKWFRFNDEGIIKFDISMLLHLLNNSSEKAVFIIYEKTMDTEDADMEKNSTERANLSNNPGSMEDQAMQNRI